MVSQNRTDGLHRRIVLGLIQPVELSEDLVCGLLVGPGRVTEHVQHEGQDYYFCSPSCAEKFRSDPSAYLKPPGEELNSAVSMPSAGDDNDESTIFDLAAIYTCPRHPEVELPGPGVCPQCGKALEPRPFVLEDE